MWGAIPRGCMVWGGLWVSLTRLGLFLIILAYCFEGVHLPLQDPPALESHVLVPFLPWPEVTAEL